MTDVEPTQRAQFESIDAALEIYYNRLGHSYRDNNGIGHFMQYVIDEELIDPDLPIENELCDGCDASDCVYTWMHHQYQFPVPPNINIPLQKKEIFIFYILQFCFKNNRPPSDSEIEEQIVWRIYNEDRDEQTKDTKLVSPTEFNVAAAAYNDTKTQCGEPDDDEVEEAVDRNSVKRISEEVFAAKYLNVFISNKLIQKLCGKIKKKFAENADLNGYIVGTVGLQINDGQMKIFKILINDQEFIVSLVNSDLYINGKQDVLFAVIRPNKNGSDEQEKWKWKFAEFLTGKQILLKYGIKSDELPTSSRKKRKFVESLTQKIIINENLIDDTKWVFVPQIKSTKKHRKRSMVNIIIRLSEKMWIKECKKWFENTDLPLIPIVVNKENKHWIEWVKIINIKSQNIYVAVSCKYDKNNNKWNVESIYLDGDNVYNMHLLVAIYHNKKHIKQLKKIKTSITKIIFTHDNNDKLKENINSLKYEIKCQQNTIKINERDNDNVPILEQEIRCFVDDNDDNNSDKDKDDAFFGRIVDDVIKEYDVLIFRTKRVGAKGNIYINKRFIKSWKNAVTPRFNDELIMYYWMDHTISISMIQKYSKQYVKKENKQFIVAVINLELRNNKNEILYGIIMYNDNNKNGDKYKYKLNALMTAEQIHKKYKINEYDLPKKSRKHCDFIEQLLLNRKITNNDINEINWRNVKLYKSPLNDDNEEMNKSVTISTNILCEYIKIGVERINNNTNNNDCNLIPILCVDKTNNYYGVEWVLIVNIIHSHCNIGVSFKFDKDKNVYILKAIYLNNTEIETKHKLIGLTNNFCQNIPSFSVKKFKLKSMKRGQNEMRMDYKTQNEQK